MSTAITYDIEEALAGSLILDPDARDEALPVLRLEDVQCPKVAAVIDAIRTLHESSRPVDPVMIAKTLVERKKWGTLVTATDLARMQGAAVNGAHATHYVQMVTDAATIRCAAAAGQRLSRVAMEATDVSQVTLAASEALGAVIDREAERESFTFGEAARSFLNILEGRLSGESDVTAKTSIDALDSSMAGGLRANQLVILAARPSVGKTSLATQMAWTAAAGDEAEVLFVSLEMSKEELVERIISQETGIPGHAIRDGNLSAAERNQIVEWAGRAQNVCLTVVDKATQGVRSIAATCRREKRKRGLKLVIVDYLQLIEPDDPRMIREQQVAKIARQLKLLSKEIGVPIVVLCQLNRAMEKENRAPRLSDLRESGAIEQDADVVVFLWKPDEERPNEIEAIIAKQRAGPVGSTRLHWTRETMVFTGLGGGGDGPKPVAELQGEGGNGYAF